MSVTVASLQARADGNQFSLVQTANTPMTSGNAPFQTPHPAQRLVPHASANRTAISWTAVFRTMRLQGQTLIVDTAVAQSFVQLVLDSVNEVFNAIDLRLNYVGVPQNATRASPPSVGQPQFLPGLSPSGGT